MRAARPDIVTRVQPCRRHRRPAPRYPDAWVAGHQPTTTAYASNRANPANSTPAAQMGIPAPAWMFSEGMVPLLTRPWNRARGSEAVYCGFLDELSALTGGARIALSST